MVQINDDYYEDLNPEIFERLLDDLAAGRPVKPGSQAGRSTSEPLGTKTSLTDDTLFDGSRLGAWRKRFEEEANKAAEARGEAEAAGIAQKAADDPRPAKPDAGRPIESGALETPAHRVADGKPAIDPKAEAERASTDRSVVVEPREDEKPNLAPQSSKSYVGVPSDPDKGHPVPEPETSPVSGTPESESNVRRDGSESKPDVVVDDKTS
jgi:NADH-quinone oxidoreductase subunit E